MAEASDDAVLGVQRSITGKRWRARLADPRLGVALAQACGLSEVVARVLAARGVTPETLELFLDPRLGDGLPDPGHLRDMERAAVRLASAIAAGEQIAIFGDYDVDGATSAALLQRFVAGVGGKVRSYIPDRLKEGYGPNAPALARLQAEGTSVVVTVDCGTTAHAPLAAARNAGLDVIVIDHHLAEAALPLAFAIVNPNRLDETSPHRQLAAVGVTFLLAVALNRELRRRGWYVTRTEPDLRVDLDLVALGTVCDVVPLTGVNRVLVVHGLKALARRRNVGLVALADVARLSGPCDGYHLGFVLGPRVNAGGRVGEADLGVRLLTTEDPIVARRLAERLDEFNRERRAIEAQVLSAAMEQAEDQAATAGPLIFAAADGWHPGVIGIVAGRLRERFNRPAIVVAFDGDIGKGSGRSVEGLDLGAAVLAARQAGLLINGGGHANAAGLTVARDQAEALRRFLAARLAERSMPDGAAASLGIDGALSLRAATSELVLELARVGPFGVGNPEPRFVFPAVRVARADVVGERHVRCWLAGLAGERLAAIAFRAVDTPLGAALRESAGMPLHLAGRLRADEWQGVRRVQLQIEDAAPVGP